MMLEFGVDVEREIASRESSLYDATIVFFKDEMAFDQNVSIQFRHDDPETLLDAVLRYWRLRHTNRPEHFSRLVAVRIYRVFPQMIGPEGHLPSGINECVISMRFDPDIDPNAQLPRPYGFGPHAEI
jgi:hypothetical protein